MNFGIFNCPVCRLLREKNHGFFTCECKFLEIIMFHEINLEMINRKMKIDVSIKDGELKTLKKLSIVSFFSGRMFSEFFDGKNWRVTNQKENEFIFHDLVRDQIIKKVLCD